MSVPELSELGPWLKYLSSLTATTIVAAAVFHLFFFFVLLLWYRRDLSAIAGCLDDFTRGLKHRSVLGRSAPLTNQIDAFVEDINDVVNDTTRLEDRHACLVMMFIIY